MEDKKSFNIGWNAVYPYYDSDGKVRYAVDYSKLHPSESAPIFDSNGKLLFPVGKNKKVKLNNNFF